ncbi:hypothetical protein [Paucihalobacter sp.]|uniref:hypothetical protein n=1 Tax=Paucihalobacter sp. TaxID=2850405 RepID=UPI002FE32120
MIKLFRNIRKNLLNEGKTTKYFKYAIGEIVLVVIGILFAGNPTRPCPQPLKGRRQSPIKYS